ncbi:hypothetical protein ARMGADRAFT_45327 [Armillaria gallica]|uniref:Uncharacterized protein n=1 Tax=Armillaria gallica TaxID=47427 RepID=A0A2H3E9S5_ARMGA|nr:hypothetical protein ARMGADRAFT_45327 [Armillaria gallica]
MIQSLYPDGVSWSQVQRDLFVSYGTANDRIATAYVSRSPEVAAVVETRGMTYIVQERYQGSAFLIFSSESTTKSTSLYDHGLFSCTFSTLRPSKIGETR